MHKHQLLAVFVAIIYLLWGKRLYNVSLEIPHSEGYGRSLVLAQFFQYSI